MNKNKTKLETLDVWQHLLNHSFLYEVWSIFSSVLQESRICPYSYRPYLLSLTESRENEPCHEIMVLFIIRKLILQTCMHSHPVGLDVWFLVGPYVYFHTSCVRTVKALARLRGCPGLPEPSLVAYVVSTIISWAGPNRQNNYRKNPNTQKLLWLPYDLNSTVLPFSKQPTRHASAASTAWPCPKLNALSLTAPWHWPNAPPLGT